MRQTLLLVIANLNKKQTFLNNKGKCTWQIRQSGNYASFHIKHFVDSIIFVINSQNFREINSF